MSWASDIHEDRSKLKTSDKRHGKTEGIRFYAANYSVLKVELQYDIQWRHSNSWSSGSCRCYTGRQTIHASQNPHSNRDKLKHGTESAWNVHHENKALLYKAFHVLQLTEKHCNNQLYLTNLFLSNLAWAFKEKT